MQLFRFVIPKGFGPEESAFCFEAADSSTHGTSRRVGTFRIARNDKRREELQFKIKDQDYFLAFVEQERRWYVFAPTAEGVHRIPVYVDAEKYGTSEMLESETTTLSS